MTFGLQAGGYGGADVGAGANAAVNGAAGLVGGIMSAAGGMVHDAGAGVGGILNGVANGGANVGANGYAGADHDCDCDEPHQQGGAIGTGGGPGQGPPPQAQNGPGQGSNPAQGNQGDNNPTQVAPVATAPDTLTTSQSVEAPQCTFHGGPARVIYFPPNVQPGQNGVGQDGMVTTMGTTLNPQSCYISFSTLWADYTTNGETSTVGPTYVNTMIPVPSSEISTQCVSTDGAAATNNAGQVNFDDYNSENYNQACQVMPPPAMNTLAPEFNNAQPSWSMSFEAPQNAITSYVQPNPIPTPAPTSNLACSISGQYTSTSSPVTYDTSATQPYYTSPTDTDNSPVQGYQPNGTQPAPYIGGSSSDRSVLREGWFMAAVGLAIGVVALGPQMI